MSETPTIATYTPKNILAPSGRKPTSIAITVKKGGAATYPTGQAMGRISVGGLYDKYDDGHMDGTEVLSGFLASPVNSGTDNTNRDAQDRDVPAQLYVSGDFVLDALVDLDAAGEADLNAREVPGRNMLIVP